MSVHREGGVCPIACWDTHPQGPDNPHPGTRQPPQDQTPPPPEEQPSPPPAGSYGQQTGGMHPTGMHNCFVNVLIEDVVVYLFSGDRCQMSRCEGDRQGSRKVLTGRYRLLPAASGNTSHTNCRGRWCRAVTRLLLTRGHTGRQSKW